MVHWCLHPCSVLVPVDMLSPRKMWSLGGSCLAASRKSSLGCVLVISLELG